MSAPAFRWSASRAKLMSDCLWAYRANYYLWRQDERVAMLRSLSGVKAWVGNHVHDMLANAVTDLATGRAASIDSYVDELTETIREGYARSEAGEYRRDRKAGGIYEHESGQLIPGWQRLAVDAERHFRAATASPAWKAIAEGAEVHEVEDLVEWELDGVPVYIKLDLVYEPKGGPVVVCDWKTGGAPTKAINGNTTQGRVYALYAKATWPREAQPVALEFHTAHGKEHVFRLFAAGLERTRQQVQKDHAEMVQLDEHADDASRFPAEPRGWAGKCDYCNFRTICPRFN